MFDLSSAIAHCWVLHVAAKAMVMQQKPPWPVQFKTIVRTRQAGVLAGRLIFLHAVGA
ncbi:Uncharacterized protein AC496_0861 [Pseudomonas savastanoi pv. glycinea]|uniref:Uncharacterized protein n=4 Tax=Pseudomonas savastanoi TaxID=29438 RepID=A0ABR5LEK0_PSESG|nr:hypothetical protein PSPPH_4528 [Pseudomonas savastanoi pv. phaseolicola 1448A]KPB32869.1 Uncharacterized protein AC515_1481 [Pseudomonas savastanoi pv. phaseolicola]KPB68384.1 Uncharacterized protein AC508_1636 [Pseudomonas amygdali pv. mellea]KPB86452.1 Uncharacterized protein AC504_3225 [Pseudomonas syringae pv. maculicola]KPC29305.1 Uncharacterized protein AC497_4843 [Pseudomonas savastanoi pv. glycinea]